MYNIPRWFKFRLSYAWFNYLRSTQVPDDHNSDQLFRREEVIQ